MCGIFGYISNKTLNVKSVFNALERRGPDNQGEKRFFLHKDNFFCHLLHSRLSIIDISDMANQPMVDDSGNYAITYNGEIYNFFELREQLEQKGYVFKSNSDTEVLLKGYICWGEDILTKLRGMFAFCIFDKSNERLFLARDPFGMKPLYYFCENDKFAFSSTIKALFKSEIKERFSISQTAIDAYLSTGAFIPPNTIVKEIKMLLPGHYLVYEKGNLSIKKYHNWDNLFNSVQYNNKTYKKELWEIIFDSVEKHLIADVPVGILLSGGIDSSIIAGIAAKISNKPIHTYSIGYKENSLFKIDETNIATKTALKIKSIHENILLNDTDFSNTIEDFINAIDVPSIDGFNTYIISKAIANRVTVVLSGLGGDEMFAGYSVFRQIYYLNHTKFYDHILCLLPKKVLSRINKSHLQYINKSIFDIIVNKRIFDEPNSKIVKELEKYYNKNIQALQSVSLFEITNYMANTLLRDSDVVSLHNSLEIRVPFVDLKVASFALSLPDDIKIDKKINKPLLVDAFKDILVEDTYSNKKRGFAIPLIKWTNEYLNHSIIESLKNVAIAFKLDEKQCPFFNNDTIFSNSINSYKWLILLKWIDKHNKFLSIT